MFKVGDIVINHDSKYEVIALSDFSRITKLRHVDTDKYVSSPKDGWKDNLFVLYKSPKKKVFK